MCVDSEKKKPRRERKGTVLIIQISLRIRMHLLICISVETPTAEYKKNGNEVKKKRIINIFNGNNKKKNINSIMQIYDLFFDEKNILERDLVTLIQREKEICKHVHILQLRKKFVLIEIPE
jgi:hypothetical protein